MKRCLEVKVLFFLIACMVLLATLSPPFIVSTQGNDKLADDEYVTVQDSIPWAPSSPEPEKVGALHTGHLGYDKKTGRFLDDPTVRISQAYSPVEQLERDRYDREKLAGADPTLLRFRSGYSMRPEPGMAESIERRLIARAEPGAEAKTYCLIQFSYPFPTEARNNLEKLGVTFYDSVGAAGMYARVPSNAYDALHNAMIQKTIRYVGNIPTQAKIEQKLVEQAQAEPHRRHEVIVLTFEELTPAQLGELENNFMTIDRRSDGPMHILEGRIFGASVQELAGYEYVRWMEVQPEITLGNLEGGMGMGSDVVRNLGFDGTGVQVMVVDTGIARSGSTYHPDLQAGRILDQYDYQNADTVAADDNSHGAHVAGSIGGLYNSGDYNSVRSWQGVAPGVDFLIYKLCCGTNQFSSTWFQQSLERATSGGRTAHISNNSWGGNNGVYTTHSEIADRAVRGEYNSQPVNMVIISHNDNLLSRAPGTGKNVITVGSVKDGNYPDTAFTSCSGTADYNWPPAERVCYSNYGPINTDGDSYTRVKPDLMAPGAMIYSTTPWYLTGYDYYGFKHGTSMAAPHVSGAIAQVLDAHSTSNSWLFNWPMVLKAMLLASAVDVGGNTNLYGRGLVDPYHSIYYQSGIDSSMSFWGNSVSTSGETKDFTFNVPAGYEEVIVVLAWADPAGANEVDNDLDILYVKDAGGVSRGSSSSYDDPVEYVKITAPYTPGTWTVTVKAFSLTSAQSFGLATHSILKKADLGITASAPAVVKPEDYFYYHHYIANTGYTAGGSYARLYVPTGFTVQGARIYTNNGYSHYYPASELRHVAGSNYWRVAIGDTLAWYDRHIRWYIRADDDVPPGTYTFTDAVYWREAGVLQSGDTGSTTIKIPQFYWPMFLPAIQAGIK